MPWQCIRRISLFFTSESVTEGNPDKLCDQISDAVLDECLRADPESRVACETYVTMGPVIVGGEVTTTALFDVAKLVRDLSDGIGYTAPLYGFDVNTGAVVRTSHAQSRDISLGVSKAAGEIGAGTSSRAALTVVSASRVLKHERPAQAEERAVPHP